MIIKRFMKHIAQEYFKILHRSPSSDHKIGGKASSSPNLNPFNFLNCSIVEHIVYLNISPKLTI